MAKTPCPQGSASSSLPEAEDLDGKLWGMRSLCMFNNLTLTGGKRGDDHKIILIDDGVGQPLGESSVVLEQYDWQGLLKRDGDERGLRGLIFNSLRGVRI